MTGVYKDMEKPQEKESNRNPGNKRLCKANKQYSLNPLHQSRTRERHNIRTQRQSNIKEKIEETVDKKNQNL
jgi:hypothetical protein